MCAFRKQAANNKVHFLTLVYDTAVDDQLKKFWEIEDYNLQQTIFFLDEQTVVEHFHVAHSRDNTGRYIVLLPIKRDITPLGESRSWPLKGSMLSSAH